MKKQSKITDVQSDGSAPLSVLKEYHLALLLYSRKRNYLLYATEIRPNYYELKLARLGTGLEKAIVFSKECFSTIIYSASPDYMQDVIYEVYEYLTEANVEDPFVLSLTFGGVANNTPITYPKRSST